MARPTIDHEATAEQLLEAAEDLIRARGAHEVSLTEVAAACGMSQSNLYRFFPSKDAFYEAMAERWFREMTEAMDAVVAAEKPAKAKMFAFFERRLSIKRARFEADPALFLSYLALGEDHHDVVHGFVDLATHFLSVIVSEAMAEGHFAGRSIDEVVQLVGLMTLPFCDPHMIVEHKAQATPENLGRVIDVIFAGMGERESPRPALRLAASEAA